MSRTPVDQDYPAATVLALRLVFDLFELARGDLDLTDAVLLLGVLQANVARITVSPSLQRQYGPLESPPPDEERRPISVLRLSAAVGLPFETVRRRVARLAGEGRMDLSAHGVSITNTQLRNHPGSANLGALHDRLEADFLRFETLGVFGAEAWPRQHDDETTGPPLRAVSRSAGDFGLRMIEIGTREHQSVTSGWLLNTLLELNLRSATEAALDGTGPRDLFETLPDYLQPVRIARLSEILGMNSETVRRRLATLDAAGLSARDGDGVRVTAQYARASLAAHRAERERNVRRLYRQLAELGCVQAWRSRRTESAGAGKGGAVVFEA